MGLSLVPSWSHYFDLTDDWMCFSSHCEKIAAPHALPHALPYLVDKDNPYKGRVHHWMACGVAVACDVLSHVLERAVVEPVSFRVRACPSKPHRQGAWQSLRHDDL